MLLVYEFNLLNQIAESYTRQQQSGLYQFTINDYRLKFRDDYDLENLNKLIDVGLANEKNNLISLDTSKWINLFIDELMVKIRKIRKNIECKFDLNRDSIVFSDNDKEIKSYRVNFNCNDFELADDIINFVQLPTFDFYIFWYDLINQEALLNLFYKSLTDNELSVSFKRRTKFSFLEEIDKSDLSEIFEVRIKEYFEKQDKIITDINSDVGFIIKKHLLTDKFEAYTVHFHNCLLVVIKIESVIEFICIKDEIIFECAEVLNQIEKLRKLLVKKVVSYNKLNRFNKNKITENSSKVIQIASIILTPVNIFFLYGISKKIDWIVKLINNIYIYWSLGGLLIVIVLGTLIWVIFPAIQLSRFNWKLNSN